MATEGHGVMSHLNRWWALFAWAAVAGVAWILLVPTYLSAVSLVVLALGVPALVAVASTFWEVHEPAPSFRQGQAEAEAAEIAARGRR